MPTRTATRKYMSKREVAEYIGAVDPTLSGYHLPEPDAIIGPINDDGSIPRGSFLGWAEKTIADWDDIRIRRPRKAV